MINDSLSAPWPVSTQYSFVDSQEIDSSGLSGDGRRRFMEAPPREGPSTSVWGKLLKDFSLFWHFSTFCPSVRPWGLRAAAAFSLSSFHLRRRSLSLFGRPLTTSSKLNPPTPTAPIALHPPPPFLLCCEKPCRDLLHPSRLLRGNIESISAACRVTLNTWPNCCCWCHCCGCYCSYCRCCCYYCCCWCDYCCYCCSVMALSCSCRVNDICSSSSERLDTCTCVFVWYPHST